MQTHEHATDRPHNVYVSPRFVLRGKLNGSTFLAFAADRAAWLAIDGWARLTAPEEVTIVAAGPEAMVGAFEMALMLGPLDALVSAFDSFYEAGAVGQGFAIG
jgi:acylphosphatase